MKIITLGTIRKNVNLCRYGTSNRKSMANIVDELLNSSEKGSEIYDNQGNGITNAIRNIMTWPNSQEVWLGYLSRSIKTQINPKFIEGLKPYTLSDSGLTPFTEDSWPIGRGSLTSVDRTSKWLDSSTTLGFMVYGSTSSGIISNRAVEALLSMLSSKEAVNFIARVVPIFESMIVKTIETTQVQKNQTTIKQTQETNTMLFKTNKTVEAVVDANKEAVKLAGKLSVGKAANTLLLSKVTSKFPWYARIFGKAKEVEKNPLAKLASAEIVCALAKHFAPNEPRLAYLGEAMLQEAMVDVVTNSTQLNTLINELCSLVPEGFNGKTEQKLHTT